MSKVIIVGTGDFAQIAALYLEQDSPHEVVAFTAHERFIGDAVLLGRPVLAFEAIEAQLPPSEYAMFVAVGFSKVNQVRAQLYAACKAKGYELISYVSSKAMQWGHVELGDNCFIFEANVLQPFVKIGNDVIIWSGNHIGHHATIGDHCFLSSHAVISGHTRIGAYSFLGVNSTIRDGVTVAPRCVIGAGATILRDTVEGGVYAARTTAAAPVTSDTLPDF
jgi:sugar O-acyltransferase (sialic acid O-acetyltransferase NeuD family)